MEFVCSMFKQNGYSERQIHHAVHLAGRTHLENSGHWCPSYPLWDLPPTSAVC
jgi:hypothetical protein